MFLKIDLQSEVPIYTQIVHHIIEGIAKKELKPGESLPSVRSLASDLGINLHTVNKAYTILKQDGYVQIHRKSGVVINPDPITITEEDLTRLQDQLRPLVAEAICRQLPKEDFLTLCSILYDSFSRK